MNRENASFLLGGIFFGFLVGFSIAHFVYQQPPAERSAASMQAPVNPSDPMGRGASSAQPQEPPAETSGAPSMETMQRVQQELAALRQAVQDNPKDARSLGRMGDLYYDAGMFDKAKEYYSRSLEVDPSNANISTDLGICFQRLGMPDEAIRQFRSSLAVSPKHWQSWLNLGIVSLFDKQDVKTAEEAFAKVKELNPSFEGLPQMQEALDKVKAGAKP